MSELGFTSDNMILSPELLPPYDPVLHRGALLSSAVCSVEEQSIKQQQSTETGCSRNSQDEEDRSLRVGPLFARQSCQQPMQSRPPPQQQNNNPDLMENYYRPSQPFWQQQQYSEEQYLLGYSNQRPYRSHIDHTSERSRAHFRRYCGADISSSPIHVVRHPFHKQQQQHPQLLYDPMPHLAVIDDQQNGPPPGMIYVEEPPGVTATMVPENVMISLGLGAPVANRSVLRDAFFAFNSRLSSTVAASIVGVPLLPPATAHPTNATFSPNYYNNLHHVAPYDAAPFNRAAAIASCKETDDSRAKFFRGQDAMPLHTDCAESAASSTTQSQRKSTSTISGSSIASVWPDVEGRTIGRIVYAGTGQSTTKHDLLPEDEQKGNKLQRQFNKSSFSIQDTASKWHVDSDAQREEENCPIPNSSQAPNNLGESGPMVSAMNLRKVPASLSRHGKQCAKNSLPKKLDSMQSSFLKQESTDATMIGILQQYFELRSKEGSSAKRLSSPNKGAVAIATDHQQRVVAELSTKISSDFSTAQRSRLFANQERWLVSRELHPTGHMYCTSRRLKKRNASWSPRGYRTSSRPSEAAVWLAAVVRRANKLGLSQSNAATLLQEIKSRMPMSLRRARYKLPSAEIALAAAALSSGRISQKCSSSSAGRGEITVGNDAMHQQISSPSEGTSRTTVEQQSEPMKTSVTVNEKGRQQQHQQQQIKLDVASHHVRTSMPQEAGAVPTTENNHSNNVAVSGDASSDAATISLLHSNGEPSSSLQSSPAPAPAVMYYKGNQQPPVQQFLATPTVVQQHDAARGLESRATPFLVQDANGQRHWFMGTPQEFAQQIPSGLYSTSQLQQHEVAAAAAFMQNNHLTSRNLAQHINQYQMTAIPMVTSRGGATPQFHNQQQLLVTAAAAAAANPTAVTLYTGCNDMTCVDHATQSVHLSNDKIQRKRTIDQLRLEKADAVAVANRGYSDSPAPGVASRKDSNTVGNIGQMSQSSQVSAQQRYLPNANTSTPYSPEIQPNRLEATVGFPSYQNYVYGVNVADGNGQVVTEQPGGGHSCSDSPCGINSGYLIQPSNTARAVHHAAQRTRCDSTVSAHRHRSREESCGDQQVRPQSYYSTWFCCSTPGSEWQLRSISRSIANSVQHFVASVDHELATKTVPFRNQIIRSLRGEILRFAMSSPSILQYLPASLRNSVKTRKQRPISSDSTVDVVAFGSCCTNLALPWSDIDLSITGLDISAVNSPDPQAKDGLGGLPVKSSIDPRHDILARLGNFFDKSVTSWQLKCRADVLQRFASPQFKPSRYTPLLTLHIKPDTTTEYLSVSSHVDISIHDAKHTGLGAIRTLKFYQAFLPTLRPLVLVLKQVLQRRRMNIPYEGGLSSYALCLMVIAFLQSPVGYQLLNLLAFYGDIPVPSCGYVNLEPLNFTPHLSETRKKNESPIRTSSLNYSNVAICPMPPEAFLRSSTVTQLLKLLSGGAVPSKASSAEAASITTKISKDKRFCEDFDSADEALGGSSVDVFLQSCDNTRQRRSYASVVSSPDKIIASGGSGDNSHSFDGLCDDAFLGANNLDPKNKDKSYFDVKGGSADKEDIQTVSPAEKSPGCKSTGSTTDNDVVYSDVFQLVCPFSKTDNFVGSRLEIRDPVDPENNVGRPCWNVSGIKAVFSNAYRDLLTIKQCDHCYSLDSLDNSTVATPPHAVISKDGWFVELDRITHEIDTILSHTVSGPALPAGLPKQLYEHCNCRNVLGLIL